MPGLHILTAGKASRHGDAMSLCIHALLISKIITLLCAIGRLVGRTSSRQASKSQSGTRAYACPTAAIDCRTGCSTQHSTDCSTFYATVYSCRRCSGSANLHRRIIPAYEVVITELIERFACSRQHKNAWPGRCCCACCNQSQGGG